ncbi:MAG TPA: TlpA disulfide reductase family protein [Pyrinomonadaceae bacterium]|nr:TlpA disulfide reductase family protein [Pyrinomonadaceae bacterium]
MTNSAPSVSDKKVFWTPSRTLFTFGVLALVAAFMLPACQSDAISSQPNAPAPGANQPAASAKPAANAPRPPLPASVLNTELKDIEGKTFKLSDYAGKVVIVNIWATWCGPCRKEIPDLIKVSNEYKSRGVELIGMTNEDPTEDEAVVKEFVKTQEIPYRIAWGNQSFELGLMQGNVKNVVPQSFVITGDGRVVLHLTGFNEATTPQRLRQGIEQALSSKG